MAEVKLSVTGKDVITYTDNAALITASIAPPSMTFVDQNPQVTMAKDPVVILTYKQNSEIEIEAPIKREVYMDVELAGYLKREIDSDEPFKVRIQGNMSRTVTNTVELEAQLSREVLSYNVGLEYGLRRVITNTIEIEGNLTRNVIAPVELQGRLTRVVVSDEDSETGIPEKKYESFIDQNKLFRVQHDVLDEDVSDNPYFEKQVSNLQNAALLTKNQTVIKAINELFTNQRAIFETTFNAFKKFDNKLGDLVSDRELNEKYKALGYRNIIDAIVELNDNINGIIDFIGSQAHDLNEMGYEDLVDGLKQLNDQIKAITFDYDDITQEQIEWVFKSTYYIPDIKDTVFNILDAMDDEIKTFEQKVTDKFIDLKRDTDQTINAYYLNILSDFDNTTKEEIKAIFYNHLDESGEMNDEDPLVQLIIQLGYQIADHKDEVRRNITALSDEMHDYIEMTESDIRRIFREIDESTGEEVIFYEDQIVEELNNIKEALTELETLHTTDIDAIRNNVDTRIGDLITAYNVEINTVKQNLANTKTELETSITSKTGQLESSLTTKIDDLETKHDTDISAVKTSIREAKEELDTLRTLDLANIRSEVNTKIDEVKAEHDEDIEAINTTISNLDSKVDTNKTELETKITDLTNKHNSEVSSITESINSTKSLLENEINNLTTLHNNDIDELRDSISTTRIALETKHETDFQEIVSSIEESERKYRKEISDATDELRSEHRVDISTVRQEAVYLYNLLTLELEELKTFINNNIESNSTRFDSIEGRITSLEEYKTTLSTNLDNLAKAIVKAFREYVSIDETEIRDILDEFEENIMDEDIANRTYEKLVQYIKNEFITIKNKLQELDNRVTILEIRTDPYIVDDSDIYDMFPELDRSDIAPDFDIDNYPVATEDDIMDMFNNSGSSSTEPTEPVTVESSIVSEGDIFDMFGVDPDEHTTANVQDILNNVATEDDILDMFGLDQSQYSSMEELLEAIKAKNSETTLVDAEEASEDDIMDMFKP